MTVGQLKRIICNVSNNAELKGKFSFNTYSTVFDAYIKGITVNFDNNSADKVSVVINLEQKEEEKAALDEAQAA